MKIALPIPVFLLLSFLAHTQNVDSTAVAKQVDSIIQISRALTGQSDFDKALEVNAFAEKIALEKCSRTSAIYGSVCFNHGRVMYFKGDFLEAEKWYLESKAIRSIAPGVGKEHPDYAQSLNNLGLLYYDLGDYEKAEPFYIEALAIRSKAPGIGIEHPDYAQCLNNLANLYAEMAIYEKAEPLYIETKAIQSRALGIGKDHPSYARSLNNLATLYHVMGAYEKAEPLYLEAKDIREKALGKDHPDYANSLCNLAILYQSMGAFKKAEPLQLEDMTILKKTLGKEHPSYAISLEALANIYLKMGDNEKAEPLLLEAMAIQEKALGKEHPDYAQSLNNLAELYAKMGVLEKSEFLYLEAKAILGKTFGKEHPRYVSNLNDLALFYEKAKRNPESIASFMEVNQLGRLLIARAAAYTSENGMLAYLKSFEERIERFQSFNQTHPTPALCQENYNNALFFNGLVLENSRLMAHAIAEADSLTRELYEKWQSCHRRLAKRYARPIAERKKIAEVEVEAETYEKMLMKRLPQFQEARKIPTWKDVQNHLKDGEAAIEFLHYRFYTPDKTDSIQYAALVLRSGWEAPKIIPLCEEKQLDSLFHTNPAGQSSAGGGERKADYVANLYSISSRGIVAVEKPVKSLFELLWKPLEKELNGVKTVFFSPTGLLHRLNLSAIPVNSDSTLADRYHLIELGSTRSLALSSQALLPAGAWQAGAGQLVGQTVTKLYNNDAILFGGIQFEMDSAAIFATNARLINADSTSRGGSWNYLKWTEKEINTIAPILSSRGIIPETRKGFEATEEAFKSIGTNRNSPRILHLATHGFFFPDPKTVGRPQTALSSETGFKTSENPLIRSGLLLAGANYAWKSGKPLKKGMENGILTAYEISHMNLSNTELVVLSACETGLGDIQGNEGVYGLQRAFKIAGAKYLIMSLWQVPDFQTQELMATFYTRWLTEKRTIPEAFRAAQQEMREKYENPYFWAGFVLVE